MTSKLTKTAILGSLDRIVLPQRCPHGNLPYGYWVNTIAPKTRCQISCPCCMWYEQAENEQRAVKMWNEHLRHNSDSTTQKRLTR